MSACNKCGSLAEADATACRACLEREYLEQEGLRQYREITERAIYAGLLPRNIEGYSFNAARNRQGLVEQNTRAWDELARFTMRANVYLHGPAGVGKTGLAYSMLNRACYRRKVSVAAVRLIDVLRMSSFGEKDLRRKEFISTCELLLLDEVDKVRADWIARGVCEVWELLDKRRDNGRTILTANVTLDALRAMWCTAEPNIAEPAIDRLFEPDLIVHEMQGTSVRSPRRP